MLRHKLRALETIVERHGVFRPASLCLAVYPSTYLPVYRQHWRFSSASPLLLRQNPLAHILIMVSPRRHRVTHTQSI